MVDERVVCPACGRRVRALIPFDSDLLSYASHYVNRVAKCTLAMQPIETEPVHGDAETPATDMGMGGCDA